MSVGDNSDRIDRLASDETTPGFFGAAQATSSSRKPSALDRSTIECRSKPSGPSRRSSIAGVHG
jgi:hypothetical protein